MKKHFQVKKAIWALLLFLFVCSLGFAAPDDPTPDPTQGTTLSPTPNDTQEPGPTPTGAAPYQVNGDVNTDKKIDIVDALLIAQYYVGMNPVGFNTMVANVNNDDKIDIVDALLVAQYYVGILPGF